MDSIIHAAANTAEDFPGGVTGMADAIGKNKFSLMHEINENGSAKLGIKDAAKMVRRSRDWRIANAFCEEVGGIFCPLPDLMPVTGGTLADLATLAREFAELVSEVSKDAGSRDVSDNAMERIEREWSETVAAGQVLMGHLRTNRERRRDERLLRAA